MTPDLLSGFLALMPDAAVVVDADGSIVSANAAAQTLFGHPPESLVGRPIEVLVPERFRHRHRQDRAGYERDPQARPMGIGLELFGRRRDGTEFPVDISLAPIGSSERPLVVAAVRDATERKAAAAAHAQLAAIVQSTQDGVISMTAEGVLTSWNSGAERLFGYSSSQVIGRHVSLLVPDEESPVLEEMLDAARQGRVSEPLDTVWLTSDLTPLDVAISVSPLEHPAGRSDGPGFSLLVRDVTQRKSDERRLRRQERWQATTAEIRLGLLSGAPVAESLGLVCRAAAELVEAAEVVLFDVEGDSASLTARARPGSTSSSATRCPGAPAAVLCPVPPPIAEALASGTGRRAPVGSAPGDPLAEVLGLGSRAGWVAAVPMPLGERRAGVLVAGAEVEPTDEDLDILASLAAQATLALELTDVRAERDRLLLTTDRERIARDLHDLVIQRLFGAGLRLQSTVSLIDNPTAAERVTGAIDDLDATIREIRGAIFALSSPEVDSGTADRVRQLAGTMSESLGFRPALDLDRLGDALDDHVEAELLAVLREALSNVARHAKATSTLVEVVTDERGLALTVVDDGVGIGEADRLSGLANARARAELLGGRLALSSPTGGGTRFEWRVPLGAGGAWP
ncbi:MAG: PAS domain-containing sensor histidine kinase [Acidimicrobiales bacterium]